MDVTVFASRSGSAARLLWRKLLLLTSVKSNELLRGFDPWFCVPASNQIKCCADLTWSEVIVQVLRLVLYNWVTCNLCSGQLHCIFDELFLFRFRQQPNGMSFGLQFGAPR